MKNLIIPYSITEFYRAYVKNLRFVDDGVFVKTILPKHNPHYWKIEKDCIIKLNHISILKYQRKM